MMRDEPESGRSRESHFWEVLCHVSALSLYLGIPFGNIIGPLIVWALKRKELPSVDAHGRESLNFQISISLYGLLATLLVFVFVGFFIILAVVAIQFILVIVATIKASDGELYEYPFSIRFLK